MRSTLASTALLCLLAIGCAARPVQAASTGVSYSTWIVSGDTVMLRFVLPAAEAERLTGSAIPVLTVSKLGEYVLEHTAVSASGRECPAIDQGYDLGRVDPIRVGPGLYGFEIVFRCAEPMRSLVLENRALFDRVPGHVNFARIQVGRHFTDQLFTSARQRLRIPDPAAVPAAGLGAYVALGFLHVLRDAGRLCFLLVALLAVRRPRPWLPIFAGLAVGYALALAVEASGLIATEPPMVEAFIGFLIALCAVAAVAPQLGRPGIATVGWPLVLLVLALCAAALRAPHAALLLVGAAGLSAGFLAAIRSRTPSRTTRAFLAMPAIMALPAAIFGFLDGFALPSVLAPLGITSSDRLRMSFGHDLGSLMAAAAVMALVVGAATLARRFGRAGDLVGAGAGEPILRRTLPEVLAAAVFAGLGTFWLVSRLVA